MNFKGKTALVIDGKRRIGATVADILAARGARVIKFGADENKPFQEFIKNLKEPIDIFINYINTEDADFKNDKDLNSISCVNSIDLAAHLKPVIEMMTEQDFGKIVNVSDTPIHGAIKYFSLKDKVKQFTKILGRELAQKNINLNAIIPGPIENEDYSKVKQTHSTELSIYFPIDRPATMDEIVEPILFLASEDANYIFGQAICVDSGFSS